MLLISRLLFSSCVLRDHPASQIILVQVFEVAPLYRRVLVTVLRTVAVSSRRGEGGIAVVTQRQRHTSPICTRAPARLSFVLWGFRGKTYRR